MEIASPLMDSLISFSETTMSDKVLVTGGTGYVARACIVALLEKGYNVRTTVRDRSKEHLVRDAVEAGKPVGERLEFVEADLLVDEGWDAAVNGCRYVLHVASPLGMANATEAQLIETARGGALRVIAAAIRSGVDRVVMTSAANASSPVSYEEEGITDETLWTDPDAPDLIPYRRSKTLAEKAAWDFMAAQGATTTLATVLPGAVFGPVLSADNLNSVQVIGRLLRGEMPGLPRIGFEIVDVRDLAEIHVRAMLSPAAAGERFLATGEFLWMEEIAETLREACGEKADKVPTYVIPDEQLREMAKVRPEIREIAIALGRKNRHSIEKAKNLLAWVPRPARETVADCGRSLLAWSVADAAGNREKLLASAHVVFAERGLAATLDDVARHAGVGVATAYRHFPNKQALAAEALEGAMERLVGDAEAALRVADPWQSFAGFFETVVSSQSKHRGLHFLSATDAERVVALPIQKRFEDAVAKLFARAHKEGVIPLDIAATDVGPILLMMRMVIDLSPPSKSDLWHRYLSLLLEGIRSATRETTPPLDEASMKIVLTGATGFAGVDAHSVCATPKLNEIILKDFLNYSGTPLTEYDACIWCLGVSQTQVDKESYVRITLDYTLAAAQAMYAANPSLRFCFVSGRSADPTEKSTSLFAKIKGRTERLLGELNGPLYIFRPGYIRPTARSGPRKDFARWLGFIGSLIALFDADKAVDCDQLAHCLIDIAKHGADHSLLVNSEIRSWPV
ncbi:hypothetical protein KCV01_g18305, partial [Aureobasidium melanogenum]